VEVVLGEVVVVEEGVVVVGGAEVVVVGGFGEARAGRETKTRQVLIRAEETRNTRHSTWMDVRVGMSSTVRAGAGESKV